MKFSVGDRVLIRRTGEEGHVVSFLSPAIAEIAIDGVRFPVYTDELDHPYLKWFTEKGKSSADQPRTAALPLLEKKIERRAPSGVSISFLPVYKSVAQTDQVDYFKLHLVNETPYHLEYSFTISVDGITLFKHAGGVVAHGNELLFHLPFEQAADSPRLDWTLQPTLDGRAGPKHSGRIRLRPAQLAKHLADLDETVSAAFYEMLLATFASEEKAPAERPVIQVGALSGPTPQMPAYAPRLVVDLHIEKLLDHPEELTAAEAMAIQVGVCRHALEDAVAYRLEKLTIIHGVGNGALRAAVHQLLKRSGNISRFSDDWHPAYGFGATVVWFAFTDDVA